VNLVSAWLLHEEPAREPGLFHGNTHDHHHHHQHHHDTDHNLPAAYVHVMADAAVAILAVIGLSAGRLLGWVWMDPLMGIVGMLVILNWSASLVKSAGAVLLDMQPDGIATAIRDRLEDGATIALPTCICGVSERAIMPLSSRS
jgi:Co/Zn/Cd efflux system component